MNNKGGKSGARRMATIGSSIHKNEYQIPQISPLAASESSLNSSLNAIRPSMAVVLMGSNRPNTVDSTVFYPIKPSSLGPLQGKGE